MEVKSQVTAEIAEKPQITATKPHATFFRQSGWLMIATVGGGIMTSGVHFLSKKVPQSEYGNFGTLLMVTACLPTMPLQMVFAQQTAQALATNRERQVAGMVRTAWLWVFALWLAAALIVLSFQGAIVRGWSLNSPVALWITLVTVLFQLLTPIFQGVLQGCQNFFWIGWAGMLGGLSRLVVAALLVLVVAWGATGMMTGALVSVAIGAFIAIWLTRGIWLLPREAFDGRNLLRQVVPLMLGFWACQFMFTSDTMIAKPFFNGDDMACYVAAGTLSRALLWLVQPLASVMFPKIVHSTAKAEKTNLLAIVFAGTAALSVCAGLGLCIFGPLAVRVVFKPEYVATTSALLPWYMAAMIPLALANVLANDLLARSCFRVVPSMVVVALAYGVTLVLVLNYLPHKLETVLQVLSGFNFVLLAVCAWFTWGMKPKAKLAVGA